MPWRVDVQVRAVCEPDPDLDWEARHVEEMNAVIGLWRGRRGPWAEWAPSGLDEDDENEEDEDEDEDGGGH
ncbi:High-osmolarity-induced transcription protein 1 [Frankliniella fusca]|uniref:High-osmolarity-induced transcription protein 1 n=1 Tax=Frankliniella fusca TaxID=407009 RepID=A0AAE1HW43_9NEOP|nr:High-osmolarity-induced transcription protein 1 [Frankliniella fusca]